MFEKSEVERLRAWHEFRDLLETSNDPIQDTIELYNSAPLVNISVDPYNQDAWPNPWELLKENTYCDFGIILAIAYTLQLTDRFSEAPKEIHISTNKNQAQTKYLLYVDNKVVGFNRIAWVHEDDFDSSEWTVETKYQLPSYK